MVRSRTLALLAALAVTAAACGNEPTTATTPRAPAAARHTVSATLWGNTHMRPDDVCLWEIFPSGGTPPYSYIYADGSSGTDPYFYVSTADLDMLNRFKVRVMDSNFSFVWITQTVSVSNQNQSCSP